MTTGGGRYRGPGTAATSRLRRGRRRDVKWRAPCRTPRRRCARLRLAAPSRAARRARARRSGSRPPTSTRPRSVPGCRPSAPRCAVGVRQGRGARAARGVVVLAADTMVVLDGRVLGKPASPARTRRRCSAALRGRAARRGHGGRGAGGRRRGHAVRRSTVRMRAYVSDEIAAYVAARRRARQGGRLRHPGRALPARRGDRGLLVQRDGTAAVDRGPAARRRGCRGAAASRIRSSRAAPLPAGARGAGIARGPDRSRRDRSSDGALDPSVPG